MRAALYNPRGIRTQREVAAMLGISQARVMQIERRALLKLVARLQRDPVLRKLNASGAGTEAQEDSP